MNIIEKAAKFYKRYKRYIDPHLAFLGAYLTSKFVIRRTKAIISTLTLQQVDIVNRYGKGTYALITGGAGGIGKEFALDLAKKGFNLILVDFNQVNLESTQQEILKIKSELIVKTIHLDFSKGNNPEFYLKFQQEVYLFFQDKISALDISILINNVGTMVGGFGMFSRIPHQNVLDAFNINLTASIMVTHTVINQMLLRDKYQSLILNMSSASSLAPTAYFFGYGATKVFIMVNQIALYNFFDALSNELKNHKNVDILTLKPFYVSTAMIDHRKGLFIITPQQLVQEAWKYAGRAKEATPHWRHQIYKYILASMPNKIKIKFGIIKNQQVAEEITQRFELNH